MDVLIELVGEILIDFAISIWQDKKMNKYLRVFCLSVIVLFYAFIIIGLIVAGIFAMRKSILAGLFLIIVSLFIMYCLIVALKKVL